MKTVKVMINDEEHELIIIGNKYTYEEGERRDSRHRGLVLLVDNMYMQSYIVTESEQEMLKLMYERFNKRGEYACSFIDDLSFILRIRPYSLRLDYHRSKAESPEKDVQGNGIKWYADTFYTVGMELKTECKELNFLALIYDEVIVHPREGNSLTDSTIY